MELDFKNEETFSAKYSQIFSYILLLIGLIFLYYGSKYFILGSNELAIYFQVPESIIGLTLVAFGTSLPELATGVVAALRRQSNIAVGTILGLGVGVGLGLGVAVGCGSVFFFGSADSDVGLGVGVGCGGTAVGVGTIVLLVVISVSGFFAMGASDSDDPQAIAITLNEISNRIVL